MPSFHCVYSFHLLHLTDQFLNLNVLTCDTIVFGLKKCQMNYSTHWEYGILFGYGLEQST